VSTTVRVSDDTHARLTALAAATGRRMQTIVEDAVAGYEANEFWVTFAAGYDGLADDPRPGCRCSPSGPARRQHWPTMSSRGFAPNRLPDPAIL